MAVLYGPTGTGKTTVATMLSNGQFKAIYVRANATWTPNAMFKAIIDELGGRRRNCASDNFDEAVKLLQSYRRALLIDEAEYVTQFGAEGLDYVRDLHDVSKVPIILVGMSERGSLSINKQIESRDRLAQIKRRVGYWKEFSPLDWEDAQLVCRELCEVTVKEDLLENVYTRTGGRIGAFTVGLTKVEEYAKSNRMSEIALKDWSGPLYLGDQEAS